MAPSDELAFTPAHRLRDLIVRKELSPAELTELTLSRIAAYRAYTRDFFGRYGLLLSLTLAVAAFPTGQAPEVIGGRKAAVRRLGFFPFTYPFNVPGNPAAMVPCGFTREELPVGLQIVGRHEDELAFEEARPWQARRPPVVRA